jgi:dual-specificity kinase
MSTPSIATTILPAHHSQYGYAHQNLYSPSTRTYPATNTLPAPQRLTTSYHSSYPAAPQYPRPQPSPAVSYRQPSNISMAPSLQTSSVAESASKRQPDWNEFYKNGVPKEIIVIDDDSPEPQYPTTTSNPSNGQPRADASNYTSNAGRKRKVDQGYDIEYSDSPTFSTHPAKFGGSSSSASYQSGDRTTSLQTVTAPTSLESYAGNNASSSYEDVRAGQKRKRVQPQKETRAQTKRKQQESTSDAFADYVPPPKPLRKAGDVHVPVIRDVCSADKPPRTLADQTQNLHKHQKVDDDDGHYIVSPNVPLTDRCMSNSFAHNPHSTNIF